MDESARKFEIYEYFYLWKDGRRYKIGVIFADKDPDTDEVRIGYSRCNYKEDRLDEKTILNIARGRAFKYNIKTPNFIELNIPYDFNKKLNGFMSRCKRYFKTDKFSPWIEEYILWKESNKKYEEATASAKKYQDDEQNPYKDFVKNVIIEVK